MGLRVWVDDWQMQCCGEPFRVGAPVSWTLVAPDVDWLTDALGADDAATVTHAEEHHGREVDDPDAVTASGTVTSIRAVYCRYAPYTDDARIHAAEPGSILSVDVESADGWEPRREQLQFTGYLVELDD